MSLQPGKEGEAGQAIGDKYGSAIPWVAVVRAIGRAVDFGGGGASRKDRERFRAAGGSIVHQGKGRWKFTYQGQRVSERKAIKIGRQGGLPGGGGGSIADRPLPSGSTYDYRIWQYLQWLWQPRGPRKRYSRKGRKRRVIRNPWDMPDKYGGWPGGPLCGTDAQCDQWSIDHGVPPEMMERRHPFVPNFTDVWGVPNQAFTKTWPPDVPPVVVPRVVLPGVLGSVLGTILGVLWPSEIGPELPLPMPTQPGQPTGPRRRYRVRVPGRPATVPEPQPLPQPQPAPRPRAPSARPGTAQPRPVEVPLPLPDVSPVPAPGPRPTSRPNPVPAWPTPGTGRPPAPSTPRTRLPFDPLQLLPLLLTPPAAKPGRVRTPVQSPSPMDAPLTSPFAYGVPSRPGEDQCDCSKRKKRKRSTCTNPITRRTTTTRGGRRYRTITRRIDCK